MNERPVVSLEVPTSIHHQKGQDGRLLSTYMVRVVFEPASGEPMHDDHCRFFDQDDDIPAYRLPYLVVHLNPSSIVQVMSENPPMYEVKAPKYDEF